MKMKKGFTLIEMLLVIGIIGILAVLIIAVLNPIEQIRRAQDTTARQDAAEFIEGGERFYAVSSFYPWQEQEGDLIVQDWIGLDIALLVNTQGPGPGDPVLDVIVDSGELKDGFQERISLRNVFFQHSRAGQQEFLWGCFVPQSQAFSNQAEARCVTPPTGYPTQACDTTGPCAASPTNVCMCVP